MNDATRRRAGNAALLAGVLLFLVGAVLVVLDVSLDVPVATLGALALIFVGAGSALRNGAERSTD